jgi:hypothetical protein
MKKLLAIHKKLLDFVDSNFNKFPDDMGLKEAVCVLLFAKSTKTFRAIQHLCDPPDRGYGEDAIILVRSLLENLINLAYIVKPQQEKEREERAELFESWLIIDYNRFKKGLKECSSLKTQLRQILQKIDLNDVRYNKAKSLFDKECERLEKNNYKTNKWSWSGLSLKWMAEEVGLLDLYYNVVYWEYSQIVHPHPGCIDSYIKRLPDGNLNICDTPGSGLVESALASSFDCYRQILRLINDIFSINLSDKLTEIENEWGNLITELI